MNELLRVFGLAVLVQFAVGGWILCMAAYKLVSVNILSFDFVSTTLFLVCILTELFLYCYYGNEVYVESDLMVQSLYSMEWVHTPLAFKRSLLLTMERAKRPLRPAAGHLIPLSLDTFVTILKSSYSFYAVLRQTKLQRRAIRIIGDEEVTKHLEPLQLRRDVASQSAFYHLYHGECSVELFSLIPLSPLLQRTTRAGLLCHRLTVATIPTRTKKFGDSFLCRTIRKWNALPAPVFPPSYNLGSFKRGVKKQQAGRQGEDGWEGLWALGH
ncbi:unnamed protein product [Chilo suppressalis]|uniref:Odorant receptor n=1 Tax=Chilo suppressalis TaxID=168631 RepID=A0ABN8BDX3_CHISP|nr:unnamed protein product [Chilo suppressalis]